MPGPKVTKYKDITVSRCGSQLPGLVSASYSFKRTINNIFGKGSSTPIATYGAIPNIDLSYTSYDGSFDINDANVAAKFDIGGIGGGVAVDYAVLTSMSFEMSVNSYLNVTKNFSGFSKPSSAASSLPISNGPPTIIKRQDFSGNIPSELSGNHLQKINGELSINRQPIPEFASRKPYASVVQFPLSASITYEFFTDQMDSLTISSLQEACKNPDATTSNVGVSACGFSFNITNAYITSIEYRGGDASNVGNFQTMSVTYTSYETPSGLEPIIIFDDNTSTC